MKGHSILVILIAVAIGSVITPARAYGEDPNARLIVTQSATSPPFSYLDESGTPQGYLIDMWRTYGRANMTNIEFKLTTWQGTLDNLRDGKADVHGGLLFTADRDRFLDFGPEILEVATVLFVRKDMEESLPDDVAIGIIRGGCEISYLEQNYPDYKCVFYPDTKTMIEAAAKGEISAFISDLPAGTHYLRTLNIQTLFFPWKELFSLPLRPAVLNGRHEVLESILYGWANIDAKTHNRIYNRWFVESNTYPDWLPPTLILLVVIAIGVPIFRRFIRHAYDIKN